MATRNWFLSFTCAVVLLAPNPVSAADYTLQLVDNSGLDSSKYSIYAMGFSYASQLVMGSDGSFSTQKAGTVSSYKVGAKKEELSQITLDTGTPFDGGRLYFFVVPAGTAAPAVKYSEQPKNPPDESYPPYTIVEMTVPNPTTKPATMDVQTVDGFVFPLTITLDGQTNVPGKQYGQPVYKSTETPVVNRADIFTAYNAFMKAEKAAGTPYLDAVYGGSSFDGQPGGILNPGAYLTTANEKNEYLNLGSSLNTGFNADINTLFGTSTLKIQGVASPTGAPGTAIPTDTYTVTSVGNQAYPGTSVSLPALEFTGVNQPANVFHVFNPVGLSILTDSNGAGITGTITEPATGNSILTLASAASGLTVGMYVNGAGLSPVDAKSTTTITKISTSNVGNTVLTLNQKIAPPAAGSQYSFSKLPFLVMFQTPGQMTFANSGVFADSTIQFEKDSPSATVLGNLENQIVSALNRGVALNPTALKPDSNNGTSEVWGDQRKWYPKGATQNLFSLFMHTGTIGTTPIFFRPKDAAAWPNARGQTMGSAYGFAYDESGGPVPPAPSGQPEVPSKFDQNIPVGSTIQITFGPWKKTQ